MRLSNATTADTVLSQLQRLTRQQADLQTQVATGQRITKPSDDPAAVARVIAAQMEHSAVSQYARNADSALEYSKTSYAGDTGRITIPLAAGASIQPTPDAATNTGLATFMNQLAALRDALQAGDVAGTQATRAGLDTSENLLVASLSEHGAIQLRIEVAQAQQTARRDELTRQISNEAEIDLPSVIVRLNQTTQSYEAALSSSATLLKMSLLDYIR